MPFFLTFTACLIGHGIADFFQGSLSQLKRRKNKSGDIKPLSKWAIGLLLHGASHGLILGVILSNPIAGLLELLAHSLIDFCKCEHVFGSKTDQVLHIVCKALWIAIFGLSPWIGSLLAHK